MIRSKILLDVLSLHGVLRIMCVHVGMMCSLNLFRGHLKDWLQKIMKIASQKNSFFAGCSARWMFDFSVDDLKQDIDDYLRQVPDSIALLKRSIVQSSLVGYPSGTGGFRDFFVSQYVAGEILRSGGSEAVKLDYGIARGLNNPSFTGWVFEMDFVQRLSDSVKTQVVVHRFSIEDENGTL